MPHLPVISGQEAIQAFLKIGYIVDRQRGSHIILVKSGHNPLSIPNHKELDRGLLRAQIRNAGLTVDDFNKLIND